MSVISDTFDYFDDPIIENITYSYVSQLLKFNAFASNTSGISSVLLEVGEKTYFITFRGRQSR